MRVLVIGMDHTMDLQGGVHADGIVVVGTAQYVDFQPSRTSMQPVFFDKPRAMSQRLYRVDDERDQLRMGNISIGAYRVSRGDDLGQVYRSLLVETLEIRDILNGVLPESWITDRGVITMVAPK